MISVIGWLGTAGVLFQMIMLSFGTLLAAQLIGIAASLVMCVYALGIHSKQILVLNMAIGSILLLGVLK